MPNPGDADPAHTPAGPPPDEMREVSSATPARPPAPDALLRRRRQGLALAAVAALIYLLLGGALMPTALFGTDVISPAAFWAQNGPFPETLRTRVPPGINLLSDNVSQFTPWLRYAADSYAQGGSIPLWKSLALCGAPLVGNGQSALFFPTNLLAIVLGAPEWFGAAQSLFKLVAGALGAYLLARHLRLSFLAALLAGLVFGFGGFQAVFLQHPHTLVSLLLPWLLLATDRLVLAPTAGRLAGLALVAGLQHLGGHPETTVHCQLVALALGAARAWSLRRAPGGPPVARRISSLVGALGLGALLGAIQTLPVLEYIAHSDGLQLRDVRADHGEPLHWPAALGLLAAVAVAVACARHTARGARLACASAIGLAVATFFGLLAGLSGGLSPTWVAALIPDWFGPVSHMLGPVNYVELNGAFAGVALPLALFGLVAGHGAGHGAPSHVASAPDPRRGVVLVCGLALLLGLLALYRAPGVTDLLSALPVLRLAENTRLSLLALLATAVLAAIGLDAVGRANAARGTPSLRVRLALLLAALALGAFGPLAYGVTRGSIANTNVPRGTSDFLARPLPLREVRNLLPLPLLDAITSAFGRMAGQQKTFAGWFALPDGLAPHAPKAGAPDAADADAASAGGANAEPPVTMTSGRLLYSRAGRSVEALIAPALKAGDPTDPWTDGDGTPLYVFLAIVPAEEFPPEISTVRLRVSLSDGRALHSSPVRSLDDSVTTRLPFPAQPAPGPAHAQLALLVLTSLALLALLDARGTLRHAARALLLVACGASLLAFTAGMLPRLPAWAYYPDAGALELLADLGVDGRFFAMSPGDMPAEIPVAYGLRDVRGYDALHPQHTARLLRRAVDSAPYVASMEALPTRHDIDLPLLGLMGVNCIANWNDAPAQLERLPFRDQAQLPAWAPFRMIRNPHFLPRARLVTGVHVEPDDARALDTLADAAFPHATSAVFAEGAPRAADAGPAGTATIREDRPDVVRVDVAPERPCTLVLADTHFPGWKALVDGVERPIARVNVAFRGVALQPGDRRVDFLYEPLSFRIGAALSAVALLVLGVLAVRARRAGG